MEIMVNPDLLTFDEEAQHWGKLIRSSLGVPQDEVAPAPVTMQELLRLNQKCREFMTVARAPLRQQLVNVLQAYVDKPRPSQWEHILASEEP